MHIILFDGPQRDHLLPLTFTRPVGALRWGILTIAEKWERTLGHMPTYLTVDYLQEKYPFSPGDVNLYINGGLCPDESLLESIDELEDGQALISGEDLLVWKSTAHWDGAEWEQEIEAFDYQEEFTLCRRPWDLFSKNGEQLEADYNMLTAARQSAPISATNTIIGDRIFLEDDAEVEGAILNSKGGPIYVGAGATIMEGSVVRGALALCEHSQLKLSAKIYGPTTIGPHSKVGGEVNNSIIQGYSNKGHDGFLGNSVIGEWCNLGADTNTSNLKNNYDEVKLWSYEKGGFEKTGLQFCGLVMGDHSKCGINTMFNTGTVVGVSANIFGSGFPRNYIPSFSWGGPAGISEYRFDKAMETASRVMERRQLELDEVELSILRHVFDDTSSFRKSK